MKTIIVILLSFFTFFANAQENPVSFAFSQSGDTIIAKATIQKGWHLYAVHLPHPNDGPLPTEFNFDSSIDYSIVGDMTESKGQTKMDDAFGIEVKFFDTEAVFKQKLIPISNGNFKVAGTIAYMVCNEKMCVPFDVSFSYNFVRK